MAIACALLMAVPALPALGATAENGQHSLGRGELGGGSPDAAQAGAVYRTRHDLSLEGVAPCSYCHLTGANGGEVKPQWDSRQEAATFSAYSGDTLPPAAKWRPQGVTLVCLSCHDGTIGPDRVVATAIGVAGWDPVGVAQIGTVFSGDHPVSVQVGPWGPGAFNAVDGGRIGSLPVFGDADQIECASCHNPHDASYGAFMRTSRVESKLCRSCHNK